MSEFKISKKTTHKDNRSTIDDIHTKQMSHFEKYYSTLPDKEKKVKKLKMDKEHLLSKKIIDYQKVHDITDKIKALETEIHSIKNQTDMLDYLFKVSEFLENNESNSTQIIDSKIVVNNGTKYSDFLSTCLGKQTHKSCMTNSDITFKCSHCKGIQEIDTHNNLIVCEDCGISIPNDFNNEVEWSTCETHEPVQVFTYKRKTHFKEWITQLQAKEYTAIPEELIMSIKMELKKERITDVKYITHDKIRQYVRKLNYNKYFEHIPYIIKILTNGNDFKIDTYLENKLMSMFDEIQEPFERHKPKDRKNFLSYSFVLYKFSALLGRNDLLKFFPLLKSREKLFEQERIFRLICADLGWEYIPS